MIRECDRELYRHLQTLEEKGEVDKLPPVERGKRPRGHVPDGFDLRQELYRVTGVDLTRIDGINVLTAQTLLAEIGPDVSMFVSEGQFASFLGLCPDNQKSGGKVLKKGTRKVKHRAGRGATVGGPELAPKPKLPGGKVSAIANQAGGAKSDHGDGSHAGAAHLSHVEIRRGIRGQRGTVLRREATRAESEEASS
jgi:transposase